MYIYVNIYLYIDNIGMFFLPTSVWHQSDRPAYNNSKHFLIACWMSCVHGRDVGHSCIFQTNTYLDEFAFITFNIASGVLGFQHVHKQVCCIEMSMYIWIWQMLIEMGSCFKPKPKIRSQSWERSLRNHTMYLCSCTCMCVIYLYTCTQVGACSLASFESRWAMSLSQIVGNTFGIHT